MKLRVKDNIVIKKINNVFAVQLLEILNKDSVLLNALRTKENKEKIYKRFFKVQ